jgi:hypothetical protein
LRAEDTNVEIIDPAGTVLAAMAGSKRQVADEILQIIHQRLIRR